jgi:hypothetical protein
MMSAQDLFKQLFADIQEASELARVMEKAPAQMVDAERNRQLLWHLRSAAAAQESRMRLVLGVPEPKHGDGI